MITYDELIEAQVILNAQLHADYLPETAQTIKSLLDKIEVALQNQASAS